MPDESASEPLRFSIAGTIATWDPHGRWLRIGTRNFWVAPGVSEDGLAPGAMVAAIGYQEDLTARWIVTGLALGAPRPDRRGPMTTADTAAWLGRSSIGVGAAAQLIERRTHAAKDDDDERRA